MSSFSSSCVIARTLLLHEHDDGFPPEGLKGAHHCNTAIALYRRNSRGLYFHLYYLNCPGKYVQWLYYQFMAPLATPLIQPLKHCNQWFKPCKRNINLSRDRLWRCRQGRGAPHFGKPFLQVCVHCRWNQMSYWRLNGGTRKILFLFLSFLSWGFRAYYSSLIMKRWGRISLRGGRKLASLGGRWYVFLWFCVQMCWVGQQTQA